MHVFLKFPALICTHTAALYDAPSLSFLYESAVCHSPFRFLYCLVLSSHYQSPLFFFAPPLCSSALLCKEPSQRLLDDCGGMG